MGWSKMDDSRADHPKLLAAGLAARGLDEACIEWCARHETDGRIPTAAVAMLAAGHGTTNWKPLARKLVEVGRWMATDGGFEVHDYLMYNPSAADLEAKREATRERVKQHRNAVTTPVTGGVTTSVSNSVSNSSPVPSRPVPLQSSSSYTHANGRPQPVDDDDVVSQTIDLLARRDMAATPSAIGNEELWLKTARARRRTRHQQALACVDLTRRWTPEQLAAHLEPPNPAATRDPHSAYTTPDGRTFLPGTGWT